MTDGKTFKPDIIGKRFVTASEVAARLAKSAKDHPDDLQRNVQRLLAEAYHAGFGYGFMAGERHAHGMDIEAGWDNPDPIVTEECIS